jgi:hypothetical protein
MGGGKMRRKLVARRKQTTGDQHMPNASQAAILLLLLVFSREKQANEGKTQPTTISRFRVSEGTLKRVWLRTRISSGFVEEVQERLLLAGWALIYAGATYAMIKVTAVEGWIRLSSRRIAPELEAVKNGTFEFASHRHLLTVSNGDDDEISSEDEGDE